MSASALPVSKHAGISRQYSAHRIQDTERFSFDNVHAHEARGVRGLFAAARRPI